MTSTFADLRWVDVLDIVIVSLLCWVVIVWIREARARVALGGIAVVAALFWAAHALDLRLTINLLQGFIALSALVVVVVFQDDLRRFFEGITLWLVKNATPRPSGDVLDELGTLCFSLAHRRIGALFVFPGREPVDRLLDGGFYLGGRVSEPLLRSLLDPATPGHDGAIVIRAGKVARFGVHLPLSTEWAEIGDGGTRHAAGLGLAERSDAFCVIVSEERGEVSVACRGQLTRVPDESALRERIDRFLRRTARRRGENWLQSRLTVARHHWREGLIACAVASGLWVHTVPGASLDQSSQAIPVVIENLPEGYRVAEIDPPEIEVIFEGRKRDLVKASGERLQVRVDGDLARLGRRTFVIEEEQVEHPPELQIVAFEPAQIRLAIEPR
ncbi:MAG: diadenylate cyclase [Myxococcota bacterium]